MMDDGVHAANNGGRRNLFNDFSEVAERLGVYTAFDYCNIIQYLIDRWAPLALWGRLSLCPIAPALSPPARSPLPPSPPPRPGGTSPLSPG